jgi:hypothetical protein
LNNLCTDNGYGCVVCPSLSGICDGTVFANQDDVMIATESLSEQAWRAVQDNKIYSKSTLEDLYNKGDLYKSKHHVAGWFTDQFISTKHMYWPVKGCKPNTPIGEPGCRVRFGALPPWVPANFKQHSYATNSSYLGYETWGKVVAIDTCENNCPSSNSASLKLDYVNNADTITTLNPDVYDANAFVHIQISEEVLNAVFTATDRALLDQAMIWAYGDESMGFEAGDFLVVAAMHVITKEIDSWAFQSVWWSPMNDSTVDCAITLYNNCFGQSDVYGALASYSGLSQSEIADLDANVGQTWRNHYLLTDSYGINYEIDGNVTNADNYFTATPPIWTTQRPTGEPIKMLPVSMNVYIEPVIHPIGTNCQNCHRRAGAVKMPPVGAEYARGVGRANYQNAQCPSLLGDYGLPANDACFTLPWAWNQSATWNGTPENRCSTHANNGTKCLGDQAYPIVNTDLSWFVADTHVQQE